MIGRQRFGDDATGAVTTLSAERLIDDDGSIIADELRQLETLAVNSHPNVAKVLGVCGGPGGRLRVVVAGCKGGSLAELLRSRAQVRTMECW